MSDATENAEFIAGFRRLRPIVHDWLARDLTGPPLDYTRAYVDLMFAYGFARLGGVDEVGSCLADSCRVLSVSANTAHGWLLRMFRYRIDEALAGMPNSGVFPTELLPPPTDQMGWNDPLRLEHYVAKVLHSEVRILDPFGAVDRYSEVTRNLDPMTQRRHELGQLCEPEQIAEISLGILNSADSLEPLGRARIWGQVLPVSARGGRQFMTRLLIAVPHIVNAILPVWPGNDHASFEILKLLTSSIEQAAAMPEGELFPPLIDSALRVLLATANSQRRTRFLGEIGWACLRWFRRLREFDGASDFLLKTSDLWPDTAWDRDGRIPESEEGAVFTATAEAALYRFLQDARGERILEAVIHVLTGNRLEPRGLATGFVGAVSAVALWPPPVAFERLIDLVRRVRRVNGSFTTERYYSRFHLQMAESIVLAFPAVRGI